MFKLEERYPQEWTNWDLERESEIRSEEKKVRICAPPTPDPKKTQDLTPPLHVNILDYTCFVLASSETAIVPATVPSPNLSGETISDNCGQGQLDWSGFEASLRAHLRRFMQVNIVSKENF